MMKIHLLIPMALAAITGTLWPGVAPRVALAEELRHPKISFEVYKQEEENVEGPDVARNYFTVGAKRMAFGVPKGCRLTTDGNGFALIPTEAGVEGVVHIGRSPFTPEFDLAENALKYREAASEKIPQGVTDVEVQPPRMNPYSYNGWKSLGFTWKYSFYGQSLYRTVGYINLELGVQIMVTTEASQTDAEKVEKIAQQFIGSWWIMKDDTKE